MPKRAYHRTDPVALFWPKVNRDGPTQEHMETPCWPWTAGVSSTGYGSFCWEGSNRGAHVVAWELTHGPVPDGFIVLHRCKQSRSCCNPDHLYIGTHDDNARDRDRDGTTTRGDRHYARLHPEKLARGDRSGSRLHPESRPRGDANGARLHPERMARGDANGNAKLTEAAVLVIRARAAAGELQYAIARDLGIGRTTVSDIVRRAIWDHVRGDG